MIDISSATPRTRRAERTRQAILNTAMDLLTQGGMESLSLREIARRMDYTPAALYEYFASKDAILEALAVEADLRMAQAMSQVAQDLPAAELVVQIGLVYLRFACRNPALYMLYATWPAAAEPGGELHFVSGASYRLLLGVLQAAVERGEFTLRPGLDVPEMAYLCWGVVHGLASLQLGALKGADLDFNAVDEPALRVLVDGLKANA